MTLHFLTYLIAYKIPLYSLEEHTTVLTGYRPQRHITDMCLHKAFRDLPVRNAQNHNGEAKKLQTKNFIF